MNAILQKLLTFFYIRAKEFNIVKFRYDDERTEIQYTLKGSFFGIPIHFVITEKSMKDIVDFCNKGYAEDSSSESIYKF